MAKTEKIIKTLIAVFLLAFVSSGFPQLITATNNVKDSDELALMGTKLTREQVRQLEQAILENPDDLSTRTKLLGYYFWKQSVLSKTEKEAYYQHVFWIIENRADSEIAGSPFVELDPVLNKESYAKAKKLWLKQVEVHGDKAVVLGNAANFFFIYEEELSEELLTKAHLSEPDNPKWSENLSHLYTLGLSRKNESEKQKNAIKAFSCLEDALKNTPDEKDKFYLLDDLAEIAFTAGKFSQAEYYADELLTKAQLYKNNWNFGNAIHKGNLVLGRIALKQGNIEGAKKYLTESGRTPGSPQLCSFGPNMILAKELLDKGEKKAVIQYFRLCGNFWKSGKWRLTLWTFIVKLGKQPDFGANLDY